MVWSAYKHTLELVDRSGVASVEWDRLIISTGAIDRVIPFKGWTAPGVFTLGGAQIALKHQACAVGVHPVFLGTGPLLYLVAYQYLVAGVRPRAVLDTAPATASFAALGGLLCSKRAFLRGLFYLGRLRAAGVPMKSGVRPIEAVTGTDGAIAGLRWRNAKGTDRTTECDALAFGYGLKPETQLADLVELPFAFDPRQRQWLPIRDEAGRAGRDGVYLAGDGAAIEGAEAAELTGARAAHAVLLDLGRRESAPQIEGLNRKLKRLERFRDALDRQVFPFPACLARAIGDDVMICRCEGTTAGDIRHAARTLGARDINRAKAFTRLGMGRCQGRICAAAAAELLADASGMPLAGIGRLRGQAPIKPVSTAMFLEGGQS